MVMLRFIQVEVTTACQAACSFCPRTLLQGDWISKHIEWADFAAVLPSVGKDVLVHLQGWGEPLLHPRLWDMAAAIKQQKGEVSLTTNGGMMDESVSRELCRTGFKFVAVSLAGATPAMHNSLRPGPGLDIVCANIERLSRMNRRPAIHIAFQMMKPNLEQLPDLVELAARLGADRVIASNLDCIPGPAIDQLRAFSDTAEPRWEEITGAALRKARERKIEVVIYPLHLQHDVPVCRADPLHTAVVTVTGKIAPCVYVRLPVKGDIPRYFEGKQESITPFSYGKTSQGLGCVMAGEAARNFTGAFEKRRDASVVGGARGFALMAMPGLRSIRKADLNRKDAILPPAPDPCRYCYKLSGI